MSTDQLENVQEEGVREVALVEAETGAVVEVMTVEAVTAEATMEKEGYYIEAIEGGEVEVMDIESSPEIRGTIIQEEEFLFETGKVSEFYIPASKNVEIPVSRRRRKIPSVKG